MITKPRRPYPFPVVIWPGIVRMIRNDADWSEHCIARCAEVVVFVASIVVGAVAIGALVLR